MKVKKKKAQLRISITLESDEELQELWHRLNTPMTQLHLSCLKVDVPQSKGAIFMPLWDVINKELIRRGLKSNINVGSSDSM